MSKCYCLHIWNTLVPLFVILDCWLENPKLGGLFSSMVVNTKRPNFSKLLVKFMGIHKHFWSQVAKMKIDTNLKKLGQCVHVLSLCLIKCVMVALLFFEYSHYFILLVIVNV